MTLKRFRVSDPVRIIKSTEVVLDNCKAFSEFWSSNSIGTTELLHDNEIGVVTKMCGCAMKIAVDLKKGTLKLCGARSKLKAELDEMKRRCTTYLGRIVAWESSMPQALSILCTDIIAMRKGLRS